jgi:hypothetical protein
MSAQEKILLARRVLKKEHFGCFNGHSGAILPLSYGSNASCTGDTS